MIIFKKFTFIKTNVFSFISLRFKPTQYNTIHCTEKCILTYTIKQNYIYVRSISRKNRFKKKNSDFSSGICKLDRQKPNPKIFLICDFLFYFFLII